MDQTLNSALGCMIGLAVGDAVGTTVEFKPRGSFESVTDMVGGGPFNMPVGGWTDDTSMALCLALSIIQKPFDMHNQLTNYVRWFKEGYMSHNKVCFDIGHTTMTALSEFIKHKSIIHNPEPNMAGNGSLMRLAPVPIAYRKNRNDAIYFSGMSSMTTHASKESVDACKYFGFLLYQIFNAKVKEKHELIKSYPIPSDLTEKIRIINTGIFIKKDINKIKGSGYVVESLEAALYCFFNTDNFKDAILMAVNLGDDADTTAAICGQIAGAFYGYEAIPYSWKNQIKMKNIIVNLTEMLVEL